ncbi:MAG: DUF2325 domain-containing protein [Oscillospiraceae bacterium]|jgi:hypothetical protein|nr:DUF2325 domain-containing protein [Oscillospiraceae bacterium]
MNIVIVGGHDKMQCRYKDICAELNCQAKVFTQAPSGLKLSIGTPNLIILLTNLCSHSMSRTVRAEAKRKNIPLIQSHGSSCSALRQIVENYAKAA